MTPAAGGAGLRPARGSRDRCIVLRPAIGPSNDFGRPAGALWLRRVDPSGFQMIVVAVNLPPPQAFGATCDTYVLTGTGIPARRMERLTGGLWMEPARLEDVPVPRDTTFEIRPGTGSAPGAPVILRGSLRA